MKSYLISVSVYTGCYRHIRIPASATLFTLHKAIINAFDFDDDHAHAFFMDNRYWVGEAYFSIPMDGEDSPLTESCHLQDFHLHKGSAFKYLFDFGWEWRFQCKVLRELDTDIDFPTVVRRVGDSPSQYPDDDDDDDDDFDFDFDDDPD